MKIIETSQSWFNRQTNRSRYSLLIIAMLIFFAIFKLCFLNSLSAYEKTLSDQVRFSNNQLSQLLSEEKKYQLLSQLPLNSKLSEELDMLKAQLNETVRPIISKTPIQTPTQMQNFLETLSNTGSQLHLDHLEHNGQMITIDLHGGYLALLQYLQTVSQTPYAFSFNRLDYQVEEYPNAKIKIILQPLDHKIDFYQEAFSKFADPTKPFNWETKQNKIPTDIKLTGIFEHDGKRIVMINNATYHVGEFVKGYEITEITANQVYLRNKTGVIVIPLMTDIKSPVDRE